MKNQNKVTKTRTCTDQTCLRFGIACILSILFLTGSPNASAQNTLKAGVLKYVNEKLAKPDGGFGWEDQPDGHLTPTYAAIGALYHLNGLPKTRDSLIAYIRSHHPQHGANKEAGPSGSELRNLTHEQIQAILWLGGDISDFKEEVSLWKSQAGNRANYEKHGNPVLQQEMMTPVCKKLLGVNSENDNPELFAYLDLRRRGNGSFNNAPAVQGGDGNILNTYWSLYALYITGKKDNFQKKTINWLQSCQLKSGGFTHQPNPQIGANDEVAYTWAGIKALSLFSAKPKDVKSSLNYLISLRNADGGFGNRPGLPSTPMSTFYVIDALKTLNALDEMDKAIVSIKPQYQTKENFAGMKVFTVQFQASGNGSLIEAVMLADSLKIDLWGAKNANQQWIDAAQKLANEKKVAVKFFHSDEPYGKDIIVPGMGTFGHILDNYAPAGKPVHFSDSSTWQDLKKGSLQTLLDDDGGLILQIANNEPMARILLDESVKKGGYSAVSTIHFGQNFSFFLPYLHQYRHQLPFVALQDAHGIESWWWAKELVSYRTLFIANEPTFKEMQKALKNNLVVAIRHDSISGFKTRMMGGTTQARQFISSQENSWKWWKKGSHDRNHPWAAITVVKPSDSLETSRPQKGINIRIRTWWAGTRQMLKEPIVELEALKVDNILVKPKYIKKEGKQGETVDAYYIYAVENVLEGQHIIEATLRNKTDDTVRKMIMPFPYLN